MLALTQAAGEVGDWRLSGAGPVYVDEGALPDVLGRDADVARETGVASPCPIRKWAAWAARPISTSCRA